ncbi:MAG: hypothetical protein RDU20_13235 [Desulfomonilaceae bacterium]|nr:hypothetical protein [Desulfomonilaceae bacterium]
MTAQYVTYLAAVLLVLPTLSSAMSPTDLPTNPYAKPWVRPTSEGLTVERATDGNERVVRVRSSEGSTAIKLAREQVEGPGDAKLQEDGSLQERESTRENDPILELKKNIIELQNKEKLRFRKVVLCSKVEGFGVYSPLPKGKLTPQFVLYFEPANVSTLVSGDRYVIDCTVQIAILDAAGTPAAGKIKTLKLHKVARSPLLDLFFMLPVNFNKPPQDVFSLRVVLSDNIKNESAGITFRIDPKKKLQGPV